MSYQRFYPYPAPGVLPPPPASVSALDRLPIGPPEGGATPNIENKEHLGTSGFDHSAANFKKSSISMIHLFNLPPGVRWRDIKNDLLLPHGIPEETILHIQSDELGSCIISLNSREYADLLISDLEGFNYGGFFLTARSDEEVQAQNILSTPVVPALSPLIRTIPLNGVPPSQALSSTVPPHSLSLSSHPLPNRVPPQPFIPSNNNTQGVPPPFNPNYGYGSYGYLYPYYPPVPDQYPDSTPQAPPLAPNGPPLLNFAPNPQRLPLIRGNYIQQFQGATSSSIPSSASSSPLLDYRQVYQYRNNTGTQSSNLTSPSISSRTIGSLRQYPYQNITEINHDKTRLFIGNIPYTTPWNDLKDYLRNAGSIVRVEISSDPDGSSKGFAIATYANEEDANRAIELFHGVVFQGRPLTVRHDRFPVKRSNNYYQLEKFAYDKKDLNKDTESETSVDTTQVITQDDGKKYDENKYNEENYEKENYDEPKKDNNKNDNNKNDGHKNDDNKNDDKKNDDKKYDDEARNLVESMRALNVR